MPAERRLPSTYAQVVVDTNVIISAALSTHGASAQLVKGILREGQLVFSTSTFTELETRLGRPKFDPYVSLQDRKALLSDLAATACWCEPGSASGTWCRDPADDKFIALALAAQVTRLVTGDNDLLCLDPLGALRLLTPRQALDEWQDGG
jgi:putative PIN family toxin of toxin-antitoxin system